MSRSVLSKADLKAKGISATNATLLKLEAAGLFPRRLYITPHSVGWFESEIDQHLEASRATPETTRRATPNIPRLAHVFAEEGA
jgi:predicted DNA-binding transcriptional regulator AlpA